MLDKIRHRVFENPDSASGHIGFNEPGTPAHATTQRVKLGELTRDEVAKTFAHLDPVPTHALSMGCGTILKARKIALLT